MRKSFLRFWCSLLIWKWDILKEASTILFLPIIFYILFWVLALFKASTVLKNLCIIAGKPVTLLIRVWPRQSKRGRAEKAVQWCRSITAHRALPPLGQEFWLSVLPVPPNAIVEVPHVTEPSPRVCPATDPLLLATVGCLISTALMNPTGEKDWLLQDPAKPRPPSSDLFPLFEKSFEFFLS